MLFCAFFETLCFCVHFEEKIIKKMNEIRQLPPIQDEIFQIQFHLGQKFFQKEIETHKLFT